MIKIAISGNIASGKSLVQKYLEELGYKVLDTDCVAHELLEDNQDVYRTFSNYDITDECGKISRSKLGKIVFNNKVLKKKLEDILHPQIRGKIKDFFDKNQFTEILFVGIPLLFEAKMENLFDKIIFVECSDEIRLQRLICRNSYSKEYALKRIKSQMDQSKKITRSDYVIKNEGTKQELKNAVKDLLKTIKS